MFLVFESSFWFLNFTSNCLNFALIAIYPMKELKLIELSLFLAPGSNSFCCPSLLFLLSFLLGVLLKHRTVLHLKPSPTRCKRYLNIQRCSFFQAFLSQLLNCIINCNDLLQIYFFILQFQSGTADPPTFLEEIFFCFSMRHVLILHFIQVEFEKMPFLSLQISKCSGGGCPPNNLHLRCSFSSLLPGRKYATPSLSIYEFSLFVSFLFKLQWGMHLACIHIFVTNKLQTVAWTMVSNEQHPKLLLKVEFCRCKSISYDIAVFFSGTVFLFCTRFQVCQDLKDRGHLDQSGLRKIKEERVA